MIISDLEHLEVVAEASSVVGGAGEHKEIVVKLVKKPVVVPVKKVKQQNLAVVEQNAEANSAAISEKGNAKSVANAVNNAVINQANVFGSDD